MQRSMPRVTQTIKPTRPALPGVLGDIADMLISTEQVHHAEGWQSPAVLHWVTDGYDGLDGLDVRRLTLGETRKHPADDLAGFRDSVADPDTAGIAARELGVPVALLCIFEVWWGPHDAPPTLATVDRTSPTRPARRSSVPIRLGMAVIGGHRLGVVRERLDGAARFVHVRRPASAPTPRDPAAGGVPVFDILADLYRAGRRLEDRP